ncbi:hypothetical protein L6452_14245 [Arctium lappa]|uniref:Uncharacterized protein n=1 Tax=Arctium lappa TaxID=4217 RepID=A0ACB9CKH7_ARCLA|nr:hypothetical protein L6452_14245 [Arctium lappa]
MFIDAKVHPDWQNYRVVFPKYKVSASAMIRSKRTPNKVAIHRPGKTKRMSIIDVFDGRSGRKTGLLSASATFQCNGLISKIVKWLPQEVEAQRKQNWDAVLVSQYLSELREVTKQG